MITSLLIYVLSLFLQILGYVFLVVAFVIPPQIEQSVYYFFSYFGYLRGLWDVDTLFQVIGAFWLFKSRLFILKIGLWVWGHLPWVGKHANLPTVYHDIDERMDSRGHHYVVWKDRYRGRFDKKGR